MRVMGWRGVGSLVVAWMPSEAARFYRSSAWDDPPMAIDLAVTPPARGGIWWDCAYQWTAPTVVTCWVMGSSL